MSRVDLSCPHPVPQFPAVPIPRKIPYDISMIKNSEMG
tara:strand:- start:368 stop:481 length:114 start_codon:yes stop_codon:yes gene_type:complete